MEIKKWIFENKKEEWKNVKAMKYEWEKKIGNKGEKKKEI